MGFWQQMLIFLGLRRRRREAPAPATTGARRPQPQRRRAPVETTGPREPPAKSEQIPRPPAPAIGVKSLRKKLHDHDALREAYVLKELIEAPLALRYRAGRTWR